MRLIAFLFVIVSNTVYAQHISCVSKEIRITGAVTAGKTFYIKALDSFTAVTIPDVTITNHKGEVKRKLAGLRGVLLKDILQKTGINSDSPKTLSEFYFVFTACDGYKVVYSWNELFNSATGNNVYLIKEKDGGSISSITVSDMMTGRRYIQGLATITIQRAQ